MAVILSYDDVFSRVQVSVTGLGVTVNRVLIERSTNQINWVDVRGGTTLVPVAGRVAVDDYEFDANVTNYYRATGFYTGTPTFVAAGAAAHANNASVVPGLPAGTMTGDLLLLWVACRERGVQAPNAPAGYSLLANISNARLFGKLAGGTPGVATTDVAPTVTFNVPVTGSSVSAQLARVRGCAAQRFFSESFIATALSQNIDYGALSGTLDDSGFLLYLGWKQDDWTSVQTIPGATEIGEPSTTLGDDQGIVWDYANVPAGPLVVPTGSFVVSGGTTARNLGCTVVLRRSDQAVSQESNSITPMIDAVWFKDVFRPFLNRTLDCIPNQSAITRRARNGIFPIIGRTAPVALTDIRLGRELNIEVITRTTTEWEEFDLILATGDIFFIQTPPGNPLPTMYVAIEDVSMRRPLRQLPRCDNDFRVFLLPLIEVAQPSPEVVGSLGTWQTVVNTYATWADVLANHSTWSDLLTLVGDTDEIIVP